MKTYPSRRLRVTNAQYDAGGIDINRITKHYFISHKTPEEENFAGGPGWKCLLVLWLTHRLGVVAGWGIHLFGRRIKTAVEFIQKLRTGQ